VLPGGLQPLLTSGPTAPVDHKRLVPAAWVRRQIEYTSSIRRDRIPFRPANTPLSVNAPQRGGCRRRRVDSTASKVRTRPRLGQSRRHFVYSMLPPSTVRAAPPSCQGHESDPVPLHGLLGFLQPDAAVHMTSMTVTVTPSYDYRPQRTNVRGTSHGEPGTGRVALATLTTNNRLPP